MIDNNPYDIGPTTFSAQGEVGFTGPVQQKGYSSQDTLGSAPFSQVTKKVNPTVEGSTLSASEKSALEGAIEKNLVAARLNRAILYI